MRHDQPLPADISRSAETEKAPAAPEQQRLARQNRRVRETYAFSLRRIAPARPIKPVPSKDNVPGSGVTILVSPLEIVVEPLKKPLPVLIVNCTVTPFVEKPVPVAPTRTPVIT